MLDLVSEDVVFEGTTPPDGLRIAGDKAALRSLCEGIFHESSRAVVETEELIVSADRCTALLRYVFDGEHPEKGHVRAVMYCVLATARSPRSCPTSRAEGRAMGAPWLPDRSA